MGNALELVSKPKAKEEVYVLCIDGTEASDSAAFFAYLQAAGLKAKKTADRVAIRNLLDLVDKDAEGTISLPAGVSFAGESTFPFGPSDLKTLPIERIPAPGSAGQKVNILLPQGKVTGTHTTYADPTLGDDSDKHETTAKKNSELLRKLILAPGLRKNENSAWHLDFATPAGLATDILYLSGHGSMAGTVCGEGGPPNHAPFGYVDYFQLTSLIQEPFLRLGQSSIVPPRWIVIAACFSLREIHAELWLRMLNRQRFPVRGILGYQTAAPLSGPAVEINRRFANALGDGATFIQAWKKTHEAGQGLAEKWTAAAFDYAENDTLCTLRDLKTGFPPNLGNAPKLYHHTHKGRTGPIAIKPPSVLLELYHWEPNDGWSPSSRNKWNKTLITNLDQTEISANDAREDDPLYVSNRSWQACFPISRLAQIDWWEHSFCPSNIYAIQVFPPFRKGFELGFKGGKSNEVRDELEISLVHVRQTYSKCYDFESVFDVVGVNGETASKGRNFWIPAAEPDSKHAKPGEVQQAKALNRIRVRCPSSEDGFKPPRLVLRYKLKNKDIGYLWFWFRVRILRDGAAIFDEDLDTFIITPQTHDIEIMTPDAPMPPELSAKEPSP